MKVEMNENIDFVNSMAQIVLHKIGYLFLFDFNLVVCKRQSCF